VPPNEPRLPMLEREEGEQPLTASQISERILRRENEQLRRRVDVLERTVKSAERLFKYVSDPPAKQLKNASRASWTKWK
jgi:hypothetical protein